MKQKLDKKRNLKEQTPKKRGKKELPVTGILAGVVVILLGLLTVLIFGLRSQERMDKNQKEARRETETEHISENKGAENSSEAGKRNSQRVKHLKQQKTCHHQKRIRTKNDV